jgi:hypothetical protein
MVYLNSVLVALALGILLGGSPAALGELRLERLWLAYAAIGLQVIAFPSNVLPWTTPDLVARGLWLFSYALLIAMILRNRHLRGIMILGAGLTCNLVAIIANRGLMPVTDDAQRGAGLSYDISNNSVSLTDPHLTALVDRFAAPGWLPLANVYSVGDVLIGIGIVIVIVLAMRPRLLRRAAPPRAVGVPEPAAVTGAERFGFAGLVRPVSVISPELALIDPVAAAAARAALPDRPWEIMLRPATA